MLKLRDAQWFQFFLSHRCTNMIFSSLFTRSKKRGEIELQQGTPEVQITQPGATHICNAPPGCKINLRCALLVNCSGVTHICRDNWTSMWDTPEVFWMARAEFFGASSLIGSISNPLNFIGWGFQPWLLNLHLRCALLVLNFLLCFCFLWINFKTSYCCNRGTENFEITCHPLA
jgi:hypothetical protein